MLKIEDIIVHKRLRNIDTDKVKELADSIKQIGLLCPVLVTKDNVLVAGNHRIEAYKLLGLEAIETTIIDKDALILELAEIDENLIRNELHYIDRGDHLFRRKEIYEGLYPKIKKGAVNQYTKVLTEINSFSKDTALKTSVNPRTVEQELQISKNILPEIKEKIKQSNITKTDALKISRMEPEKQKTIIEKIITGEAKGVVDANRCIIKEEVHEIPIINGLYDVIYADPPWRYDFAESDNRAIENKYPSMDLEDIKSIKVPSDKNAVLFLWATAPKLIEALEVMKAWGFSYKTNAIWDKEIIGMGYWFRGQHELLLVGTKGNYSPPIPENRESSVYKEKRMVHSKKPLHYFELIEKEFPKGKYIEMFSRHKFNEKWEVYGNQVE